MTKHTYKEKLHIAKEAYKAVKSTIAAVEGYKDCSVYVPWDKSICVDGWLFDGTYIEVGEYWYDENDKPVFYNPPSPAHHNVTHWHPLPEKPND